jgi:hypothetical protein
MVHNFKKKSNDPIENDLFLHESQWFFEVLEIIRFRDP